MRTRTTSLAFAATLSGALAVAPPAHAHSNSDGNGTMAFSLRYDPALTLMATPHVFTGGDLGAGTLALECSWQSTGGLHWTGALRFSSVEAPITGGGANESLTSGVGTISFPSVDGASGAIEMDMPGGAKYVGPNATFHASATGSYVRSLGTMFLSLTLTGTVVDPDGPANPMPPVNCPDSTFVAELAAVPYTEASDVDVVDPEDPPVDLPVDPPVKVEIQEALDLLDAVDGLPEPRLATREVRRIVFAGHFQFTDG